MNKNNFKKKIKLDLKNINKKTISKSKVVTPNSVRSANSNNIKSVIANNRLRLTQSSIVYNKNYVIKREIDLALSEFLKNNKDFDFEKQKIIIKFIDGKYKAFEDKRRKEKIDEIFDDDNI